MPVDDTDPPGTAEVADIITARIEAGEYAPGARIPPASALMAEFGVSRRVAVDAMELLAQRRLTRGSRGRGTRVRRRPARQTVNVTDVSDELQALVDRLTSSGKRPTRHLTTWQPGQATRAQAAELQLEPAAPVVAVTHQLYRGDELVGELVELYDAEAFSLQRDRQIPKP